jgi:hypothetical protein
MCSLEKHALELAILDKEIQEINAWQGKLNQDYDAAPDGSQAKRDALAKMSALGVTLSEKWARVNELVDEDVYLGQKGKARAEEDDDV